MKNWKVILQSKTFFFLLFLFLFIYLSIYYLIPKKSAYLENENIFYGTITEYFVDGDSLSFILKGKEKLKVYYTIENELEKNDIIQKAQYGSIVEVKGQLEYPKDNSLPNTFSYKDYLYYNHILYVLNANNISFQNTKNIFYNIKNKIRNYLITLPHSQYYLAFLLGDTKTQDLTSLRSNGISHLFAISGMHISFFTVILHIILKKRKYHEIIISLFLIFYAFLVGFTPSVLRVVLYYILNLINKISGNIFTKKQLFYWTIIILLLYDPFFLKNIGFQYSFCIRFLFFYIKEEKSYLKNLLKVSFIAFLASVPITAYHFYEINILGIFLNIIFVPFVSLLLYPLCFIVLICPFMTFLFTFLINIFEKWNSFFASITFFKIVIPKTNVFLWIGYYALLYIYLKKSQKKLLILLIFFITIIKYVPKIDTAAYVYFLDVGQGDSTLFISPFQKEIFLIDTGGKVTYQKEEWRRKKKPFDDADTLKIFLNSLGISSIDSLILTHGDYDHIGNALSLLNKINTKNIILNRNEKNKLEQEIENLYLKKITNNFNSNFFEIREFSQIIKNDENDSSLIFQIKAYQYSFLMMGDASKKIEEKILPLINKNDVLKLGHHGSNTSSALNFLKKVKPKYAIISVSEKNRYGHPSKDTITNLNNLSIPYYETSKYHTICFKITKKAMEFFTFIKNS